MRLTGPTVRILLVAAGLVGVVAVTVVSAMGAQNQRVGTTNATTATSLAVTDSTAPAGTDGSTRGVPVTDTTLAPPPEPEDTRSAQTPTTTTPTTQPTTSTTLAQMEWDYYLRRSSHPAWDDRMPASRAGLEATACNDTLKYELIDNPNWYSWWGSTFHYLTAHDELIALALENPGWEPHHGPGQYPPRTDDTFRPHTEAELNQALTDLGVSSAQDIRDMGGEIEVRWYAWWLIRMINLTGDPTHPDCASIIAGANAVLTPYTPIGTDTTNCLSRHRREAPPASPNHLSLRGNTHT